MSTTVRSAPTTIDTTGPVGGFIHDIFDLDDDAKTPADDRADDSVDADFGDAERGALEASWGDWVDAESGDISYEWAVMEIDPRQRNPVGTLRPGALLRDAVAAFVAANDINVTVQAQQYGVGRMRGLYEADNGIMLTDWIAVGNKTSGFREDVELISGYTYVTLLRITNAAGVSTVSASDGIVFDRTDPCIGQPHAGLNPHVIPRYLTTEGQLSAVWGANIDPLHKSDLSFRCTTLAENVSPVPEGTPSLAENGTVTEIVDVPVVPLSHMEWQLRKITSPANNTLFQLRNLTGLGENDTLPTPGNSNENVTDSVTVMPLTPAGPRYASGYSACCSSYSEHNAPVLSEDWDWRPTGVTHRFGQGLDIAQGRFVAVAGYGSASLFDVLSPSSRSYTLEAADLDANAGVSPYLTGNASTVAVAVAADVVIAVTTTVSLNVLTLPMANAHALVVAQPPEGIPLDSPAADMELLAAFAADDAAFAASSPSGVFAAVQFAGSVATAGRLIAVSLEGVLGSEAARGVAVLSVADDGTVSVVDVAARTMLAFGDSLAFSVLHPGLTALAASVPAACRDHNVSADVYSGPCADAMSRTHGNHITMFALVRTGASWTMVAAPSIGNSTGLAAVNGRDAFPPSSRFGSAVAAAPGGMVAVGDVNAGLGNGQVSVHRVHHSLEHGVVTEPVCVVSGGVAGAGLGYSVSMVSAVGERKVFGPAGARNNGTALIAAGSPASNMVAIIRVNLTAAAQGETGKAACQMVAIVNQALRFTSGNNTISETPPLYGAGTAVAMGGGMVVFSSPFERTWPTVASPDAVADAMTGTGRVFGTSFCWAGDVRRASVASQANVPFVCASCSAGAGDVGDYSLGGTSGVCESCEDRVCRDINGSDYFTAVNNSAPLENGQEYVVDVTAVSRSGRRNTATSPRFKTDWTPPTVGDVFDTYLGNESTCIYCEGNDIDVTTNVTYLSLSWCCGWQDLESGLDYYSVAFGTSPNATDVLDWTNVGLEESFTLYDLDLVSGQSYYGCVVATNEAGLFSAPVCSDGLVYDMTPPAMERVDDGLVYGLDLDFQNIINMIFATFAGGDADTDIWEYVFSLGTSPGATDVLAEESSANATLYGVFGRPFDKEIVSGDKIYANVRAVNDVGLSSEVMSSNGITIGKEDVTLDPQSATNMALDTQEAVEDDDPDGPATGTGAPAAEPKKTVAAVSFPAGAVGERTSFVGGATTPEDVQNGDAVDPDVVPPPAQNFKFGNHSCVPRVGFCVGCASRLCCPLVCDVLTPCASHALLCAPQVHAQGVRP